MALFIHIFIFLFLCVYTSTHSRALSNRSLSIRVVLAKVVERQHRKSVPVGVAHNARAHTGTGSPRALALAPNFGSLFDLFPRTEFQQGRYTTCASSEISSYATQHVKLSTLSNQIGKLHQRQTTLDMIKMQD